MRVIVYEPDPTGHHFAYLAHVMPALAELPCEPILLTSSEAAASQQFAQHLGPHAGRFAVNTSLRQLEPSRSLGAAWRNLRELGEAITRLRADHVYVAYGDGLAEVAGLARLFGRRYWNDSTSAEVLLLRGGYTYPRNTRLAKFRTKLSPGLIRRAGWDRVHHLNPDDLNVLRATDADFAQRCRLMPDPIEPPQPVSKIDARRRLGISELGRYIGAAGLIDTRKGVDRLLRAFAVARPRLAPDDRLLLAGPMQADIRQLIADEFTEDVKQGRLVHVDRSLTTAEMNLAVAAMDVVATPYPQHIHSASIVIRAAAVGRPVLGSAIGWMQRTINQFSLGSTCDVMNNEALTQALVATLQSAGDYVLTEAARRFVEFHSARNFAAHWTARLRERLGQPADCSLVEWDWVLAALPK